MGHVVKILKTELLILFSSFTYSCFYLTLKLELIRIPESNKKEVTEQFWGDSWYLLLLPGHPVHQSLFKGNF